MSSSERSNSAVRNLRSIFENKDSESPSARGRSPGSLTGSFDAQQRPTSRIRASFIPVEPTMAALAAEQSDVNTESMPQVSSGARRTSFNDGENGEAHKEMKETVDTEQERRDRDVSITETIPEAAIESAVATPAAEVSKMLGAAVAIEQKGDKEDKEAANPDKPVTGAEEEPVGMKPADPTSESAVSGGEALPPVAEDLRKTSSKAAKPASISTKSTKAAPNTIKSPIQPKTPVSVSSAAPSKKSSRSSLTAPTSASVARHAAAEKQAAPATSKPKPREVTKPLDVSSRLTAPTAASRARLESTTSGPAPSAKPTTSSRVKPAASSRSTPRTALAGTADTRLSLKPVDGSFLERMTRPTAASSNRSHEKTEVKSPARQKQLPLRPKPNGALKIKPAAAAPTASTAAEPVENNIAAEPEMQEQAVEATDAGLEKPSEAVEQIPETTVSNDVPEQAPVDETVSITASGETAV